VVAVTDQAAGWQDRRQQIAELYTALRDGVFRYLVTLGLDAAKAQDITQEAFLRLHSTLRDGAAIEDPKSWVYRVAHNMAVDALGRGQRESAFPEAIAETVAVLEKNAEQKLIEKQWLEGFRNAMRHLSPNQRLCLELRAQGMRYREIAEILQVRTSTVGQFLRRGVSQLRKWDQWRS